MALPTLNWRYCAPVTLAANTTVGILDALHTAGNALTYNDGTPRTPGTGSAWTWNRDTGGGVNVASYGTPPVNTLSMQYIVAGATTLPTPSPTMIGNDSNVVNRINIGMNKNSGSYAGWNQPAPFTSGQFSGYANAAVVTTSVTYTTLYYWECQEAFIAQLFIAAGSQGYAFGGGAFIDPLSADALDTETDGRVYSITSTGNSSFMSTAWLANISTIGPWNGDTAAGGQRFYQFLPGSGSIITPKRISTATAGALAATSVTPGGEFPSIPQFHFSNTTSGQYLGCLRQIVITRAARTGQRWSNGGVTVGYILSPSTALDQQAAVLLY